MRLHRLIGVFATSVCLLFALATTAVAMRADNYLAPTTSQHQAATPTVVKESVVRPGNDGISTIGFVLIGVGGALAVLGAGYLGARIATRTSHRPIG